MKLQEHKRLVLYLALLAEKLEQEEFQFIHPVIKTLLNIEKLAQIILWLFPKKWTKEELLLKSKEELFEVIGNDVNILEYMIYTLEEQMTNTVKYSQEEVSHFFEKTQREMHYLASKPVTKWDSYDKANYHSLLKKTNSIKKVYGIFTSDVLAEDVYAVTTKPSFLFDSREEAEAEIQKILREKKFKQDELTVHKLWLIQKDE